MGGGVGCACLAMYTAAPGNRSVRHRRSHRSDTHRTWAIVRDGFRLFLNNEACSIKRDNPSPKVAFHK